MEEDNNYLPYWFPSEDEPKYQDWLWDKWQSINRQWVRLQDSMIWLSGLKMSKIYTTGWLKL